MKRAFVLLSLVCSVSLAADTPGVQAEAQLDGSVIVVLSPDAVQVCMDKGGCRLISRDDLLALILRAKPKLCSELDI